MKPITCEFSGDEMHSTKHTDMPRSVGANIAWAAIRVALAVVFLWTFLDKTLALGWATGRDAKTGTVAFLGKDAWISGASPTAGFLKFGTSGPLAPLFKAISGSPVVDWLFMLGMGGVGLGLLLGVAWRLTISAGVALMVLLRLAVWTDPNNPIVDEHVVYALVLLGIAAAPYARWASLDRWWRRIGIVRTVPLLQ
jgi:thiosulfate dehydrogenase [quinone] large subunit